MSNTHHERGSFSFENDGHIYFGLPGCATVHRSPWSPCSAHHPSSSEPSQMEIQQIKHIHDTYTLYTQHIYMYILYVHDCVVSCVYVHIYIYILCTYTYVILYLATSQQNKSVYTNIIYTHTTCYIAFHYITLHYIRLVSLHYVTLHYITLHYVTYIYKVCIWYVYI